jgi:hypothetical protein
MSDTTRSRIERLEKEMYFRMWVRYQRFFESLSVDELDVWAATGQRPERPEPAPGMSRLDGMTREELQKLWKEDQQWLAGRNREEWGFFSIHGHWPEQGCGANCRKTQKQQ